MRKKIILISGLIATPLIAFTYPFTYETCSLGYTHVHHQHNEASYQKAWCSANAGIEEYENKDKTRVDCLTATHAVEFDFANKWAESLGQAMHYGYMTGKKPKVVLILDNPKAQMVYFRRIQRLGKKYDIETIVNISFDDAQDFLTSKKARKYVSDRIMCDITAELKNMKISNAIIK